jgi:hypothetical protein
MWVAFCTSVELNLLSGGEPAHFSSVLDIQTDPAPEESAPDFAVIQCLDRFDSGIIAPVLVCWLIRTIRNIGFSAILSR